MTAAPKIVEPGIYRRGSIDYASIDAVNFSTLKVLAKSALHYRHIVDCGMETSAPMRLGEAAHTATLDPVRFTRDYAVYEPPEDKTDRRGTKAWKAFEQANAGKTILKDGEFTEAMLIRDAVRSDKLAMRYLRKGEAEQVMVWIDKETGMRCKARADFLSTSVPDVVVELKTAADVCPWKFASAYARMQYHLQAAFYCDGLEAITGRPAYHKCIAVESKEPRDVVVYDVIGDVLDVGREAYGELLKRLAECRTKNEWLGQGAGAEATLRLPAWAVAEGESDLSDLGLEL